jgi:hypothetical protein
MSRIDHQFTCPECGSHHWGSSGVGTINAKVHCHGDVDEFHSCRFSFPYDDLYKYSSFILKPDSLEMYRALCDLEDRHVSVLTINHIKSLDKKQD